MSMNQSEHDKNRRDANKPHTSVTLLDIVDALEMQSDTITSYLNLRCGEVILVAEESLMAAQEGECNCPLTGKPLDEIKAMLAEPQDYLKLPTQFDINEFEIMERFAASVTDSSQCDTLLTALRMRRPFRHFKDAVHRLGLAENWYMFRTREFEQIAVGWCKIHGIAYDRSRRM